MIDAEMPRLRGRHVLLSFDTEEFDLPVEFGRDFPFEEQMRVAREGLARVTALLDELVLPATFFCTARFASEAAEDVVSLAPRHEVASHGWTHTGWTDDDPARSRELLTQLRGDDVVGFRAPRFRQIPGARLRAAGYDYDAGLNPTWIPGRYCQLRAPRHLYRGDGLWVMPAAVTPRLRVPLFWLAFKRLPLPFYTWMARGALRDTGVLSLVFHPWEFADIPAGAAPRWVARPNGVALTKKLRRLLLALGAEAAFCTHRSLLAEVPG